MSLYQPFVDATRSVFQLMLDLQDIIEAPAEGFVQTSLTDVKIGVTGDLQGEVVYRFPNHTSLNMVNIMCGMEIDSVDEFVTSAISELANIISGNVLTMLAERDLTCDILPPVLCDPDESGAYSLRADCRISTSAGDVCLEIRLNPRPEFVPMHQNNS